MLLLLQFLSNFMGIVFYMSFTLSLPFFSLFIYRFLFYMHVTFQHLVWHWLTDCCISGIWADHEESDNEDIHAGFGSKGSKKQSKNYSAPVTFVSGGIKHGNTIEGEVCCFSHNFFGFANQCCDNSRCFLELYTVVTEQK